jgi:hypothetical protein
LIVTTKERLESEGEGVRGKGFFFLFSFNFIHAFSLLGICYSLAQVPSGKINRRSQESEFR